MVDIKIILFFQFMRTVFLAMHRAVKAMWIVLSSVVTPSRSPNKQTKGEAGIEHLRHFDKSSQILYQYL